MDIYHYRRYNYTIYVNYFLAFFVEIHTIQQVIYFIF